jgi:biopolymer transport protein ExbD
MSLGRFDPSGESAEPLAEINTTPMVDVMLVLLVIFIVTAPLLTPAIRMDLPRAEGRSAPQEASAVQLSIDAQGRVYWDGIALASDDALARRMSEAAASTPPPGLQVRADREVRYERLAVILATAQRAGLNRLAFITEPQDKRR